MAMNLRKYVRACQGRCLPLRLCAFCRRTASNHARNSLRTKECIRVKNTSSSTLNLTGYTIRDSGPWKFTFAKGKLLESCRYKGKRTKATKTYVRSTATTAYC